METPNRMSERSLSPSETARRLGVGVRALRLYERRGLVCPGRTQAGWRVYSPNEIERLHQVLTLKSLGLSLARITQLLGWREADLQPSLLCRKMCSPLASTTCSELASRFKPPARRSRVTGGSPWKTS